MAYHFVTSFIPSDHFFVFLLIGFGQIFPHASQFLSHLTDSPFRVTLLHVRSLHLREEEKCRSEIQKNLSREIKFSNRKSHLQRTSGGVYVFLSPFAFSHRVFASKSRYLRLITFGVFLRQFDESLLLRWGHRLKSEIYN
jgi:hypothetical protein